ncbi:pyridine nucleotidedisulfide oxidoreductasedomain containing protein [Lichtheimia corymbifera JMRC:FSU:9682]|uniref:Pyridine nucleotidedisulfide oxidoreductasedomain containing protein n=1 Tax=Lichtheimia corymbifera JMRC:FSU:9682 TaxID=1263082 RepID=A0A068RP75_9FUNG|nr:pyridine nucleotidedisulfide oxidoreductasedomain containing protein [Lichtheimia corymbifera JMRC:FSU:9682]
MQSLLSDPKLLQEFKTFLDEHSHGDELKNDLIFVEAMTQLHHESDSKKIESLMHRIYKTFLAPDATLPLTHVSTGKQVKRDLRSLAWSILGQEDVTDVLKDTEDQVETKMMHMIKEFEQYKGMNIRQSLEPTEELQPYKVRVVIVGGGFTGFTVASILDRMPLFHVTLIDTKACFEYTPGIVKRIVHPEDNESDALRVRHDSYVRNGRVIIGYAEGICNNATSIRVNGEKIFFEYLLIATGSSYTSDLKSTDPSYIYRLSGLHQVSHDLAKAKRVLIVGGGLVGCELAIEIAETWPEKHITLVESHPILVHRAKQPQQDKVRSFLSDELGVEVVCDERITDVGEGEYMGTSGRIYKDYDKVFMATGTRPQGRLLLSGSSNLDSCVDSYGRIMVKPTLQIDHPEYTHIFAGGDVTNVKEEKTGYAATLAGVCIARNICRMCKGKKPLHQGAKGTLPAPDQPLSSLLVDMNENHRRRKNMDKIKKYLGFLNPTWAALKCYDEQEYLQMVQGESSPMTQPFGRLPRTLCKHPTHRNRFRKSASFLCLDRENLHPNRDCK